MQNESMSEDIPIGSFMGLISGSLRNMVLEILGGETSVPLPVQPHYVLFIFAFIGVANAQAKWRQGNFRILPQFWSLSHGKGILRSIKVENLCGDVRKHPHHKLTRNQQQNQELSGRKRRGDIWGSRPGSSLD